MGAVTVQCCRGDDSGMGGATGWPDRAALARVVPRKRVPLTLAAVKLDGRPALPVGRASPPADLGYSFCVPSAFTQALLGAAGPRPFDDWLLATSRSAWEGLGSRRRTLRQPSIGASCGPYGNRRAPDRRPARSVAGRPAGREPQPEMERDLLHVHSVTGFYGGRILRFLRPAHPRAEP